MTRRIASQGDLASGPQRQRPAPASSFGILPRSVVTIDVIQRIKEMIRVGTLRPGDRLPPERTLSEQLGVSRNSLREGIRALVLLNILQSRQGDGTYVTSLDPELLMEPVHFVLNIDRENLAHLFEVRRVLESGAASLAAQRISEPELLELASCLAALRESTGNQKAFVEEDVRFHGIITRAAQNPLLTSLMVSVSTLALQSRSRTIRVPGVPSRTISDHTQILRALKARDADRARDAMIRHISHVEEAMRKQERVVEVVGKGSPPNAGGGASRV